MKTALITSMLVAGLFLSLIPGGAWAASNCYIYNPANTTYTNATGLNFELRCKGLETIRYTLTSQGIPNVTVKFYNGTAIRTLNLSSPDPDNTRAKNSSGTYPALQNGVLNFTFFYTNTTSTSILNQLTVYSTIDTEPSETVLLRAPTNTTYSSNSVNVTCNTTDKGSMTYQLDGVTPNVTLTASVTASYIEATVTIPDGAHNLTCTATDPQGWANSSARTYFTVNASAPNVMVSHEYTGKDLYIPIDDGAKNTTLTFNVSHWGNLSGFNMTFSPEWALSVKTNLNFSNLTYGELNSTNVTVFIAARKIVVNLSAPNDPSIFNGSVNKSFGLRLQHAMMPGAGTYKINFTWNGTHSLANDTVIIYVRDFAQGPILLNNTCGSVAFENRTANRSVINFTNNSACNLTFLAPFVAIQNVSLTNYSGYGWECSAFCKITNYTTNSTRFLKITAFVPANTSRFVLKLSSSREVSRWPIGKQGAAGGAGLAIVYLAGRKYLQGRRRRRGESERTED